MAGVCKRDNGHKEIQFKGADGKRRSIRLGKMSMRNANATKTKVEELISASISGHAVDDETARWLAKLDSVMSDKLANVGLMARKESFTLENLVDQYFKMRTDVKTATLLVWGHTRRNLIEFFGSSMPLRNISKGNAEEWHFNLIEQGLSKPTIRKRCGIAKQFFSFALKQELISSNPFADLKSGMPSNPDRYYFVSREEAEKVLDACPDAQWRLLFALSRYGGLRCPSEHMLLKWEDVNWADGRITVTSPKTEHHEGGGSRAIPIFPELRPYLEEAFDLAEPGTEFVITRYRKSNTNLRTQLTKIIKRAGLNRWPKLFQNLRSTRQTELGEEFPIQVVCSWIGNTKAIAAKHYLQVTEDHFEQAQHNPTQYSAVYSGVESQADNSAHEKSPLLQGPAVDCQSTRDGLMDDIGLEPTTSTMSTWRSSQLS
jgi:integrase